MFKRFVLVIITLALAVSPAYAKHKHKPVNTGVAVQWDGGNAYPEPPRMQLAFPTTTISTINTSIPATNSTLSSAPLRANFTAAYNDINNIYAQLVTPTNFLTAGTGIGITTGGTISVNNVPAAIDATICGTQGAILYRSATAWSCLLPGTLGQTLITNGAANNPAWGTLAPASGGSTQFVSAAASGGTANAQTFATVTPGGYTLAATNPTVCGIAGFTNTGAVTLSVNSTAATAVRIRSTGGLVALAGGEIVTGNAYCWFYDGTYYEQLNPTIPQTETQSGNYSFAVQDGNGDIYPATGATPTFTLPLSTTLPPSWRVQVYAQGGPVIFALASGTDVINAGSAGVSYTIPKGSLATIATNASGVYYISGGQINFTEPGTGAITTTIDAKIKQDVSINLADFGAVGNGVTDDTAAINAAITACPSGGCRIKFSPGKTYCVSSQINVGNGSTLAQSTTAGIYFELEGSGLQQPGTSVKWCGTSSANAVFYVTGPIQGWGFKNITIDCNSLAGVGLHVVGGLMGQVKDVKIFNCNNAGILTNSLVSAAVGSAQTQLNNFSDVYIQVPTTNGASGIYLGGNGANITYNTSSNVFDTIFISLASTTNNLFGVYLQDCDSNSFRNLFVYGGGSGSFGLAFDYTGASAGVWPANNLFQMYDPDGLTAGATKYINSGAPAAGARPNRFYDVMDTNTAGYPKIANSTYNAEVVNPGVVLTGQTAAITATNLNPIALYAAGLYRLSWYLETTTTGTAGTITLTSTWTDDAQVETANLASAFSLTAKGQINGSTVVKANSATNITYATTLTGVTGSPQYGLYIKLEKLD